MPASEFTAATPVVHLVYYDHENPEDFAIVGIGVGDGPSGAAASCEKDLAGCKSLLEDQLGRPIEWKSAQQG